MTRKTALALILAALVSSAAIAGERSGNYTIRNKDYRVEGYVSNGKIYDRDYRIKGYISPNGAIRDRNYRTKGHLEKDNRGQGRGSGKHR